jgi:hypothetical protein
LVTIEYGIPEIFNREDVIVRHELGHAVVWYHYGGALGRMRFHRMRDGLLMGGVQVRGREADMSQDDYVRTSVVRLLAGEIAARIYLRLPLNHVASELDLRPTSNVRRLRPSIRRYRTDFMRAIDAAFHIAGPAWWPWLLNRHSEARAIVEAAWPVIDASAKNLQPNVPSELDSEWRIPGLTLIEMFERGKIRTLLYPPFEVVHPDARGTLATQVRRFWRSRVSKSLFVDFVPPNSG